MADSEDRAKSSTTTFSGDQPPFASRTCSQTGQAADSRWFGLLAVGTAKIMARNARNAAVQSVQMIVRTIRANPLTSDEDLMSLGLPVRQDRRQAIPAPQSRPLLAIAASTDGLHHMRFADERTPTSRRKPPDVLHLQLYMAVGKALADDVKSAAFHSLITKSPFDVHHDPANNGLIATYFGRWSTRTGLTGPWSLPVGMTITFVQRGG